MNATGIDLIRAELAATRAKGFSPETDAAHPPCALRRAATAYLTPHAVRRLHPVDGIPETWQLPAARWKPTPADRQRELIRAGALLLADAERALAEKKLSAWRALTARAQRVAEQIDVILATAATAKPDAPP